MMTSVAQISALLDGLEEGWEDAGAQRARVCEAAARIRAILADMTARAEAEALLVEAKDEQIHTQRGFIQALGSPVLRVREDVLCAPLVGVIDADRVARLMSELLAVAGREGPRLAVVDLTGALLADVSAVPLLEDTFRALALLGVRGALSGLSPSTASAVLEVPGALRGVPVHATLAAALAAR